DRHAVGFLDVTAKLVDDLQPLLRHAGRAVHHQVGTGDALVDCLDAIDGQDVTGRRFGELVGAVAGADGNGQGIDLGAFDEVSSLFRVGVHLAVVENTVGAGAVFFTGSAGLQAAQATQFAFHGNAAGVGHGDGLLGHAYVVLIVGRGLAVFHE